MKGKIIYTMKIKNSLKLSAAFIAISLLSSCVLFGNAETSNTSDDANIAKQEISLNVATFNVAFCRNTKDYEETWLPRRDLIMPLITFYDFDICGLQEPYGFQIEYIVSQNKDYAYVTEIKDKETPEDFAKHPKDRLDWNLILSSMNNPILYKKDKFEVLESGRFWLSETPEVPYTGRQFRHCIWAKFKEKNTGKTFYVFNTHLPTVNRSKAGQLEAADLCAKVLIYKMEEIAGNETVFVMGDFNALDNSEVIKRIESSEKIVNSRKISKETPYGPNFSFVGYNADLKKTKGGIIDYIYVSKNVGVEKIAVIGDHTGPTYPSDHLPVFIKAKF